MSVRAAQLRAQIAQLETEQHSSYVHAAATVERWVRTTGASRTGLMAGIIQGREEREQELTRLREELARCS